MKTRSCGQNAKWYQFTEQLLQSTWRIGSHFDAEARTPTKEEAADEETANEEVKDEEATADEDTDVGGAIETLRVFV